MKLPNIHFLLSGVIFITLTVGNLSAGSLEPPAGEPKSTMVTLQQIYNKIDEIKLPLPEGTPPFKTGQIVSYAPGDDGDLQKGIDDPAVRFTDNGDGTIRDNRTGLIWLKNANFFGTLEFISAKAITESLSTGTAGLSDGSSKGDWRLPEVSELASLSDFGNNTPALPSNHPFINVMSEKWDCFYWTNTTSAENTENVWVVTMDSGLMNHIEKTTEPVYVWPVRNSR